MKATLKITSKGQVTLRRELLDELGVRPGDRIVVEPVAPGRVEIRRAERFGGLAAFVGCLKQAGGPALALEDIRKVAREGWAGEQ
jgi:antitoxin PrlF